MKISTSLCVLLSLLSTLSSVDAAWGFGSFFSKKEAANTEVQQQDVNATRPYDDLPPTSVDSRSLKKIIHDERRFVLFNSRRLSGECLPICLENETREPLITDSPTKFPTKNPTNNPTNNPTKNPTNTPTKNPTNTPTKNPTNAPTKNPTNTPTKNPTNTPTKNPTNTPTKNPTNTPTKNPTNNPTNIPTNKPTRVVSPTDTPTKEILDVVAAPPPKFDCENMKDLGYGFSAATGNPHYSGKCYPAIVGLNANNLPGRDDSVAVFVGGSYLGRNAAEVEGNMVVLGDLTVKKGGPTNFVSVGVGTHVLPNSGGECIKVGGNIKTEQEIQVFNQAKSMYCDIVYKGSGSWNTRWNTNGEIRQDMRLDLSEYESMKDIWERKSKYWATLKSTGQVIYEDWGNAEGQTTYQCSTNDDIQVFNVQANERKKIEGVHSIYVSRECEGKTILINVHGTGYRRIDAAAMHFGTHSNHKKGYGPGGFPTCVTSSMLWNFPDATTVDIGNGRTSEFHGSVLVTGKLKMTTTGQSGRTIVLGDIIHDRQGSEFHSYEYNPPRSLPDPDNLCVGGGGDEGAMEAPPSESYNNGFIDTGGDAAMEAPPSDTYNNGFIETGGDAAMEAPPSENYDGGFIQPDPTQAPTVKKATECTAIPKSRLPQNVGATNDNACKKCKPPNNVSWYPCNKKNPPICEGNCIIK